MANPSAHEVEGMFHWFFIPLYAVAIVFHLMAGWKHFKARYED